MQRSFVEENAQERERLRALVSQMTDDDLQLHAGGSWTVAALLAHLAFWDYRALVLLERWQKTRVGSSPIDIDGVNDAVLPLCNAIAPRVAANLALSAAEAVDRALEGASLELIAGIEALGGKFRLRRWEHRREHLEQIERVLESKRGRVALMPEPPKLWMPRERWEALVRGENCPLCDVIQSTEPANEVAITIADLSLSRLFLKKNQFVRGYCTLVCCKHVREPYHLTAEEQSLFFGDMMRAAQALERVFNPAKMNIQLLGNEVPHLHAHLVPRYYGDPAPSRPIDPGAGVVTLAPEEYQERIRLVRFALEQ